MGEVEPPVVVTVRVADRPCRWGAPGELVRIPETPALRAAVEAGQVRVVALQPPLEGAV